MIDFAAFLLLVLLIAASLLGLWQLLRGRARTRRRAWLRGALCAAAALVIGGYGSWKLSDSRTVQLVGTIVPRVETGDSLVALTFDDGPLPGATERVLAVLEREGAVATFFLTGSSIREHLPQAGRIAAAGHEIGNHSYSHPVLLGVSLARIRDEIRRTDAQIRHAGYAGEIHFRAPYGKKYLALPLVLAREGRTNVLWDVEPESDPEVGRDADRIAEHVLNNVRPGSIVLLHVMFESRAESLRAVGPIVQGLHERGYRLVTVSELLRQGE
jgi:peptidoglycan-N-acetylglucosamine deacetylase